MNTVLDESKVERGAEAQGGRAVTCRGLDTQEAAKRIEKGLNDAKAAVSSKMDDAKVAGERLLKRGRRYAVQDGLGETTHMIKSHPVSSIAIGEQSHATEH